MNAILKLLTLDFISPYLGSLFRHLLTMVSGVLVTAGVLTSQSQNVWVASNSEVLVALALYLWAQLGSFINKAQSK